MAYAVNADRTLKVLRVGREGEPVAVIDGFFQDPRRLAEEARTAPFADMVRAANYYPGRRAPASRDYLMTLLAALKPVLAEVFGLPPDARAGASCMFSLVTLSPEELNVGQRLPHIDDDDPRRLAILHYLTGPEHGGTAFFRHRATGFETVGPDRSKGYFATLRAELAAHGEPPAAYPDGDGPLFEETARIDAAVDRVIVYRSCLLHSALVDPARLSPDPREGRLTVNTFLTPR